MPIGEEIVASEAVVEAGLGVGVAAAAPFVLRMLRPAAKAVIKAGIVLYRGTADVIGEATKKDSSVTPAPQRNETAPRAKSRRATAGGKPRANRSPRSVASRPERRNKT